METYFTIKTPEGKLLAWCIAPCADEPMFRFCEEELYSEAQALEEGYSVVPVKVTIEEIKP